MNNYGAKEDLSGWDRVGKRWLLVLVREGDGLEWGAEWRWGGGDSGGGYGGLGERWCVLRYLERCIK